MYYSNSSALAALVCVQPSRALDSYGSDSPLRGGTRASERRERLRRLVNIGVAVIGLVLIAPLMLAVALLIRLESRGPAIYRQPRVGLDRRGCRGPEAENHRRDDDRGGRIFTIYKFRTMTTDRFDAAQKWATKDDARVTRVGKILRPTRIDELPQLFNVLKGDMNIVGPRPEQPSIFADLRTELNRYPERQKVLPGITGWAQVNLGYDTSIDDVKRKVELDLEYIDNRSATQDLTIMAKTIPVMVFGKVWS
jgi:lipopolysaccharide/colanic/teichoic acid biosynthesis glycosyltransferase